MMHLMIVYIAKISQLRNCTIIYSCEYDRFPNQLAAPVVHVVVVEVGAASNAEHVVESLSSNTGSALVQLFREEAIEAE